MPVLGHFDRNAIAWSQDISPLSGVLGNKAIKLTQDKRVYREEERVFALYPLVPRGSVGSGLSFPAFSSVRKVRSPAF